MQSKELLRAALDNTYRITLPLLEDLKDAPLAFPTPRGGNHALWLAGHLAYGVGQVAWECMRGEKNPLDHWGSLFGFGTEPSADAGKYPAYEEVLGSFRRMHGDVLALLDNMSEQQLDQRSRQIPQGLEDLVGTYRQCFMSLTVHLAHHRGQAADCRRALGRKPIQG